ncbi:MAG TPA: hypothetical protein VIK92_02820 [Thermaerobacter sp.]
MRWLGWAIAGLAAVPAGFAAYFRLQGDADIRFDPGSLEVLEAGRWTHGLRIRFRLPVTNRGRQKGMLYEILTRPEYVDRWMKDLRFSVSVFWPGVQETGYWAATLLKPGEVLPLEFELLVTGAEETLERLLERPVLGLVTRHGVIGRLPLRWHLTEVRIPLAAVRDLLARTAGGARQPAGAGGPRGDQPERPAASGAGGPGRAAPAPGPVVTRSTGPRRGQARPRVLIARAPGGPAGGNGRDL